MAVLRLGTRGSDLALTQSRWFCAQLVAAHTDIEIQEVIIKTHGDLSVDQPFSADMPVGIFVSALERALTEERIDLAVHSFKDLQTTETEGLVVAAIPEREVAHDVLLTREPVELDRLSAGFRVGTSSPRRSAQFRRLGNVEIVPIRGNVPTRVGKLESGELDGVILAAAGLKRLGISHPHATPLPTDRFVPSPAQGALAVQVRESSPAENAIRTMDHAPSRRVVEAERSFLKTINAGCHTPVGALADIHEGGILLRGQLFSDDGDRMVEGTESGDEPIAVGRRLAEKLMKELGASS